jgi:hypothetical protein
MNRLTRTRQAPRWTNIGYRCKLSFAMYQGSMEEFRVRSTIILRNFLFLQNLLGTHFVSYMRIKTLRHSKDFTESRVSDPLLLIGEIRSHYQRDSSGSSLLRIPSWITVDSDAPPSNCQYFLPIDCKRASAKK